MQTSLYFAYGANMHIKYMNQRCPEAIPVRQLDLRDWELKFYNHATILPVTGTHTPGVLWTITEECESLLDNFEGYPSYYTKRKWSQDGVEFFFYEMTPANYFGSPGYNYVSGIIESYNTWNIPAAHLESVLHATRDNQTP